MMNWWSGLHHAVMSGCDLVIERRNVTSTHQKQIRILRHGEVLYNLLVGEEVFYHGGEKAYERVADQVDEETRAEYAKLLVGIEDYLWDAR